MSLRQTPPLAAGLAQVQRWAGEGESEYQEFKETTGRRAEAARTLCAFSNLRGGRVVFGVLPDGEVRGQQVTDHTLEKIFAECNQFDPEITPMIERVRVDDALEVVIASVNQGRYRPYRYKGQAYKRVGTVTSKMGNEEYQRLFLETAHSTDRWEIEPCNLTVDDLDLREVEATLDDAITRGRISDPVSRDPMDLLRGLGLVRDGELVNAAAVLFGRQDCFLPSLTQCTLKLVRYEGVTAGEAFADIRQEHGNAFHLLRVGESFLRRNLSVEGRLRKDETVRLDRTEIPMLALREALANAVSHREYSTGAGSIMISYIR